MTISERMAEYIEELIELDGFGDTRQEVIRRFIDSEVNRLIADKRLKQRQD